MFVAKQYIEIKLFCHRYVTYHPSFAQNSLLQSNPLSVHYFMHLGVWVMYQVIGVTRLVSWEHFRGLQTITVASYKMLRHSAFHRQPLFKTVTSKCFYVGDICNLWSWFFYWLLQPAVGWGEEPDIRLRPEEALFYISWTFLAVWKGRVQFNYKVIMLLLMCLLCSSCVCVLRNPAFHERNNRKTKIELQFLKMLMMKSQL